MQLYLTGILLFSVCNGVFSQTDICDVKNKKCIDDATADSGIDIDTLGDTVADDNVILMKEYGCRFIRVALDCYAKEGACSQTAKNNQEIFKKIDGGYCGGPIDCDMKNKICVKRATDESGIDIDTLGEIIADGNEELIKKQGCKFVKVVLDCYASSGATCSLIKENAEVFKDINVEYCGAGGATCEQKNRICIRQATSQSGIDIDTLGDIVADGSEALMEKYGCKFVDVALDCYQKEGACSPIAIDNKEKFTKVKGEYCT